MLMLICHSKKHSFFSDSRRKRNYNNYINYNTHYQTFNLYKMTTTPNYKKLHNYNEL